MAMAIMSVGLKKQGGYSFWSLLVVGILAGSLGLIGIKVFPAVYDGLSVEDVFRELPEDQRILESTTKKQITTNIVKKLYVNGIRTVTADDIEIVKDVKRGVFVVTLNYEVRVPIIDHFDAVIWFNNKAEVPST